VPSGIMEEGVRAMVVLLGSDSREWLIVRVFLPT